MRLAEALILRADLNKAIDDLRDRISNNAVIQEGTEPAEDPNELLKELHLKLHRFEKLVVNINSTNLTVKTESGMSLNDAISRRDTLSRQYGILNALSSNANRRNDRYSRTEILNVSTIDIPSIQQKIEALTQQKREIEVEIQAANWTNDLIEDKPAGTA